MRCSICKRVLNVFGDPMSLDCGGDCWGCIGLIEKEMGDPDSTKKVNWEIAQGLRNEKGQPMPNLIPGRDPGFPRKLLNAALKGIGTSHDPKDLGDIEIIAESPTEALAAFDVCGQRYSIVISKRT